jgi:hypothetical protein
MASMSQKSKQYYRAKRAIRQIDDKLEEEQHARDVAFTRDIEFAMSDARVAGLKAEREELEKIVEKIENNEDL